MSSPALHRSESGAVANTGVTGEGTHRFTTGTKAVLALLRVALGFTFLWAFLDKTFGLGYSTPSAKSWINGGSPTKGFLSSVAVGPFESFFHSIAGTWWANWLFMLGLLGIGVALILGVVMKISAWCATIMMAFMWAAEWPLAKFTSAGEAAGSTNPITDYHVIYALAALALAFIGAGAYYGLGNWWSKVVGERTWLR